MLLLLLLLEDEVTGPSLLDEEYCRVRGLGTAALNLSRLVVCRMNARRVSAKAVVCVQDMDFCVFLVSIGKNRPTNSQGGLSSMKYQTGCRLKKAMIGKRRDGQSESMQVAEMEVSKERKCYRLC